MSQFLSHSGGYWMTSSSWHVEQIPSCFEMAQLLTVDSGPSKFLFRPPHKDGLAKNIYTKSERLSLSWGVTWALSEKINLYSQQIMILLRKTKTYAMQLSGHVPRPWLVHPSNLHWLPPPCQYWELGLISCYRIPELPLQIENGFCKSYNAQDRLNSCHGAC